MVGMTRNSAKATSDHLQSIITKAMGGEQRCHAQKGIGGVIMREMDASCRARQIFNAFSRFRTLATRGSDPFFWTLISTIDHVPSGEDLRDVPM